MAPSTAPDHGTAVMELYQKESIRRIRRNSKTLLQDMYGGVSGGERQTPILPQMGRDAKMIHSVASLIRAKSKLLLLESPDTVEIYKLHGSNVQPGKDDIYLPAIKTKPSNLSSMAGALSQSCPYLYDKRRGSFSSVASQRTGAPLKRQSHLKAQREAKKSNVTVTMTYLGQGRRGSGQLSTPDELKVLQQVNGGENIIVFKGLVTPGEQFQFVSQRHRGFPFSATLYVNSLMVARISSCCEYRYAPGFQQGRKSCFRLSWLSGGVPCYRCTSLRNKSSSCQQLNHGTKESVIIPLQPNPGKDGTQSCPSSPLFIPAKPERVHVRRTRKQTKKADPVSTESDDLPDAEIKETCKKRCRKGQKKSKDKTATRLTGDMTRDSKSSEVSQKSSRSEKNDDPGLSVGNEMKTNDVVGAEPTEPLNRTNKGRHSLQDEGELTKRRSEKGRNEGSKPKNRDGERLKDFYKECVEMSEALERSPNKHNWFKANILERCRIHKKLSCCPQPSPSDVELSPESDNNPLPDEEKEEEEKSSEKVVEEQPAQEQNLQAQLNALMTVLSTSDEVEQLILRNTDLTDDLLLSLAGALKSSRSEVTLLNLNLNLIGPYGAHILLDVLRVKPQVKGLHLFGNKLRDHGLLTLLSGVAELQDQTARAAAAIQQAILFPSEQNLQLQHAIINSPAGWSSFKAFALLELDIGGNKLGSEGVKVLASYMRSHSCLQYLGLAQTSEADLSAWKELFDSIKGNSSLTQINLDENNLGDPGVRLLADALMANMNLKQVDLDCNGISDVGGNDIMGALLSRNHFPLTHLSLQENNISPGLIRRIHQEVKQR